MKDMKTQKGFRPPKAESWMTTDEEERTKRRDRATVEPMKVKAVDAPDGFGRYEVSHAAADRRTTVYHVEIRDLDAPVNSCDCPDFTKSGLGTCKHVERVLKTAARKCGKRRRSPSGEFFMGGDPCVPRFVAGDGLSKEACRSLQRCCEPDGRLKDASSIGADVFLRLCNRLNEITPGAVRISDGVRRWQAEQARKEALVSAVDEFREAQGNDGNWPFLKKALYPYQREGALHLAGKGRALLADEMGLGKTVQAIAAALLLREVAGVRRALVVVPASLKGEWEEQIAFFSDAAFESLYGMRQTRLERYAKTKALFLIANYEQVIRDWKEINDIYKPDLVILDEAQRIKNWKTKTARNIKGLSSPYAFVLTGTPLENRIDELYSLVEFVDPQLFGSLFRFNRRFYAFDDRGKNEGMCNLDQLHDVTAPILLRRRKAAVEDELPGRTSKTYKTGMTPEQERRYLAHLKEVASLYDISKRRPLSPKEQERLQIELGLMRMLCDSCYITDQTIKDSPKLDEFEKVLDDLFADDPTRKVIVFSEWTRMLDLLIERLDRKGIAFALHTGAVPQKRRREEIRRFKEDPDCRVFLASESGGVGLNLQVASVVANLDLPWNPAKLEQRIARAWRKNQKRDVLVVNMVAGGTIEERMLQTLSFKQGLADFVLDAMGDAADFELQNLDENKGRKKQSAFMQRLATVMGGAVKVEPERGSDASAVAAGKRNEPPIPPEERLRAEVEATAPGIQRLTLRMKGGDGARTVTGAVVVGRGVRKDAVARQIAESHGVALPDAAIETIDPETWKLMKRLEAMGVIQFCAQGLQGVVSRTEEDLASVERETRRTKAGKSMEEVARLRQMGELLWNGGFASEAQSPLRKAVLLAAGTVRYAFGRGDAEADIAPAAADELVLLQGELDLQPVDAETLDLAARGADLPNAVPRVRHFVDECGLMM